ncbi:membrane-bound lytic murein transglycosylase A precursor [mine drainage metagenome]|uniref:peptidoglycan lytic exotransglycosylase n=1 Tax=mine drainage metagenome TaxID=410659 RepID=A0A1J5PVC9_9ZZZZ
MKFGYIPLALSLLLGACAGQDTRPPSPATTATACTCAPAETLPPLQIPDAERYTPPSAKPGEAPKGTEYGLLHPAEWGSLPGFDQDNLLEAWGALKQSCSTLKNHAAWHAACEAVAQSAASSNEAIRALLVERFNPYQVINPDGSDTGLITGYYEPLLNGSRTRSERYRYPLYSRPDDLIDIELGTIYPELASHRLRGKLNGNRLIPYYSRGEIDITPSPLAGKELLWVDDIVDLFFLQIQGSGIIRLENGDSLHVGYADQNGQRYQSIGRVLIEQGELTADKASMQGIKEWGRRNPDKLRNLLNSNPSYVFFRELPNSLSGPFGALGVPIAAERSLAVDPRYIPLGAPVFLSTTFPNSNRPLQRLMLAQDTGGAIKGAVRADLFWGTGLDAGRRAGAMKQNGSRMWVLLPKDWVANGGK